ncbi:predicted protein [Scheffersomyces stipitis CBS 6054]|uniref:Uncharacterized protein n=1 Tax=Scheffersomyces stipitis (strain ATCC 58785 / CBS 6054 / NBRC 10063 / NRRL Y-11545) TaxID=322104 RepID=A3LP25_PICST|nr:predicted protein [Scheffersomyces stipitis CBS 6054]ABN64976.1 predicted protein [Scheffersomyces stipitis CBS 6054]KAG2736439.1 hypothetical protein G9P44_000529 [Scheffersomyces stipitis]
MEIYIIVIIVVIIFFTCVLPCIACCRRFPEDANTNDNRNENDVRVNVEPVNNVTNINFGSPDTAMPTTTGTSNAQANPYLMYLQSYMTLAGQRKPDEENRLSEAELIAGIERLSEQQRIAEAQILAEAHRNGTIASPEPAYLYGSNSSQLPSYKP